MLWMITGDKLHRDGPNLIGRCGDDLCASLGDIRVPPTRQPGIKADCNYDFRLLDGDGEHCFTGVCKDLDDQDGDAAFEPLDMFMHGFGVVEMQYRKKGEKEWKTL
jgi:hypothetical protein